MREEPESAIRTYQHLIKLLPPPSRYLLLYILDFLAAIADESELNKMNSTRLAAIFQPAILSPIRAHDDYIEEAVSQQHSQEVLVFLLKYQDHFLFVHTKGSS